MPKALTAGQGHLYWANNAPLGHTVGGSNLDGTGRSQWVIDGGSRPCGVAVDATHVYWTLGGAGVIAD